LAIKDNLQDLADPFIDLANEMAEQGTPPEVVGTGFIYGAARYAAFLTLLMEEIGDKKTIEEQVDTLVQKFREALHHHLDQHPIADGEGGGAGSDEERNESPDVQPSERGLEELAAEWDHMAVAMDSRDVLLTSYLRGTGNGERGVASWRTPCPGHCPRGEMSTAISPTLAGCTLRSRQGISRRRWPCL
jgi:hypothetical protein